MRPRLFVVSGPSGAGKGTLVTRVRERRPDLDLAVSATTRPPRPGEVDGVDYHFVSPQEFSRLVATDSFLEWAEVVGNRYGTLISEVDTRLRAGRSIIVEINVQGAMNVRRVAPDAVLIFVRSPSHAALEERLRMRGTESEEAIAARLAVAPEEIAQASNYDVEVVNDDLDVATDELLRIIAKYESK